MPPHAILTETFSKRAEKTSHPLTSYLLRLMDLKASNLCLSADVTTARELLQLADSVGPSIVVLKTHHDVVSGWDFNPQTGTGARLAKLARKHGFLIFEDRKFCDIGNTVQMQYVGGSARIIDWAHIVNTTTVPGKAAVAALAEAAAKWRERYQYEVRTSVSVGTPKSDNFDEQDEERDEFPPPASAAFPGQFQSPFQSSHDQSSTQQSQSPPVPVPGPRGSDGRKGSIVSVTTLTQHYESAASPRFTRGDFPPGDDIVYAGIEDAPAERGLLILAQMSSAGNTMNAEYTQTCVEAARDHKDFVMGFVAQENLNTEREDEFLHMTPGCQLPPEGAEDGSTAGGDGKGQQYNTPQKLIGEKGTDIIIVGRGIIKADSPAMEAERYRSQAWKAYLTRVAGSSS